MGGGRDLALPPSIRIERYTGPSQESVERLARDDAHRAATAGYQPIDQVWEGRTLAVRYRYVGQHQAPAPAPAAPQPQNPPVRIERYTGVSAEDALRRFAADAENAQVNGYRPTAQTWEGRDLLVTYTYAGRAARESGDLYVPAVAVVIGGAIAAIGSVLPWVSAVGGFGITVARSGIETGDGLITIVLGIIIVLLGLTMIRGVSLDRWRAALAASIILVGLVAVDYFLFDGRVRDLNRDQAVFASIGVGLYVTGIGGLVAAAASWRIRG